MPGSHSRHEGYGELGGVKGECDAMVGPHPRVVLAAGAGVYVEGVKIDMAAALLPQGSAMQAEGSPALATIKANSVRV